MICPTIWHTTIFIYTTRLIRTIWYSIRYLVNEFY
nr:MAG TPA: hypothetical protein [Bacteriophage sp.]